MEKLTKNLKIASIVVLVFTASTFIDLLTQVIFDTFKNVTIPAGAPENVVLIAQIVLITVSFILLLPAIYIGIRGLQIAKNPTPAKGHIVWGAIILAFAVIDLIGVIISIATVGSALAFIGNLCGALLDVVIYFEYVKHAKDVAVACQ